MPAAARSKQQRTKPASPSVSRRDSLTMPSVAIPPSLETWTEPPLVAFIETTFDALLVLEAARRRLIPRVTRRLADRERKLIASGSVFVFEEEESGIKRWTDGFLWSPSRILGNFLIYRETDKKNPDGSSVRPGATRTPSGSISGPSSLLVAESHDDNPSAQHPTAYSSGSLSRPKVKGADRSLSADALTGMDRARERVLLGSLTNSSKFKDDGMMKKTFSITLPGTNQTHHLVSYYKVCDVEAGRLRTPSSLPELAALDISPDFLEKTHFRVPPKLEIGEDGRVRYRGEQGDDIEQDSPPPHSMDLHSPTSTQYAGLVGYEGPDFSTQRLNEPPDLSLSMDGIGVQAAPFYPSPMTSPSMVDYEGTSTLGLTTQVPLGAPYYPSYQPPPENPYGSQPPPLARSQTTGSGSEDSAVGIPMRTRSIAHTSTSVSSTISSSQSGSVSDGQTYFMSSSSSNSPTDSRRSSVGPFNGANYSASSILQSEMGDDMEMMMSEADERLSMAVESDYGDNSRTMMGPQGWTPENPSPPAPAASQQAYNFGGYYSSSQAPLAPISEGYQLNKQVPTNSQAYSTYDGMVPAAVSTTSYSIPPPAYQRPQSSSAASSISGSSSHSHRHHHQRHYSQSSTGMMVSEEPATKMQPQQSFFTPSTSHPHYSTYHTTAPYFSGAALNGPAASSTVPPPPLQVAYDVPMSTSNEAYNGASNGAAVHMNGYATSSSSGGSSPLSDSNSHGGGIGRNGAMTNQIVYHPLSNTGMLPPGVSDGGYMQAAPIPAQQHHRHM